MNYILNDVNTGSSCLQELGRIFRYYRFNRVLFHFPAPDWTTANFLTASYVPSAYNATVPSWLDIESEHLVNWGSNTTVPTELALPGSCLNPQHDWFVTTADASETNAETIGSILFRSETSSNEELSFSVTIEYEFCGLLDPATVGPVLAEIAERYVPKAVKCPSTTKQSICLDTASTEPEESCSCLVCKTKQCKA